MGLWALRLSSCLEGATQLPQRGTGRTQLMLAVATGDGYMVKLLLQLDSYPNPQRKDDDGRILLHYAMIPLSEGISLAVKGNVVKDREANTGIVGKRAITEKLRFCSHEQDACVATIRALLLEGADLHDPDDYG